MRRALLAVLLAGLVSACSPSLPEPESEGAKLYAGRCSGCHTLHQPKTMKFEMWKVQTERMQGEMARRGVQPLSPAEMSVLLDYLRRNAG